MICTICGRDIDALGQDNMSAVPACPMCEDCFGDKMQLTGSDDAAHYMTQYEQRVADRLRSDGLTDEKITKCLREL